MKRRNADISKLRRPLKKSKISDSVCGSTFIYVKMVLLWCGVLTCDFMFELRFEYFWPLWMFSRSVYESFRYQGMAFSLSLVLLTVTSDLTCYILVPVNWLCFTASVYVWVQYVWHADRGVCLPTVSLWVLFVYVETWLHLHSDRHTFLHTEFSRHFAAHCIGYQAVTLGFTVKSYVAHRLCLRRQRLVAAQNGQLFHMLYQSLPPEVACVDAKRLAVEGGVEVDAGTCNGGCSASSSSSAGAAAAAAVSTPVLADGSPSSRSRGGSDDSMSIRSRCRLPADIEYTENRRGSVNEFDEGDDKEKNYKNSSQSQRAAKCNGSATKEKKARTKDNSSAAATAATAVANTNQPPRDDVIAKLEVDVKRLRADLNSSRQSEQELRSQLSNLAGQERSARGQLHQLQLDNDQLQHKLHSLATARQHDKQSATQLEKKLLEEKRARSSTESQLQSERKKSSEASQKVLSEHKSRVRELECEMRQLRRENKQYSERICSVECELKSVRESRESQTDTEVLMSALTVMQERNQSLEKSLSSENQVKMNLYAALGDIKRELEISRNVVALKEREVCELNSKLADVLSVSVLGPGAVTSPSNGFGCSHLDGMYLSAAGGGAGSGGADLFDHRRMQSNKLMGAGDTPMKTQLDPNAATYTPKLA